MRWYIFTVWVLEGPEIWRTSRRYIMRIPGRTDHPNHEDIKAHVIAQIKVSRPDAELVFAGFSESKDQGQN